MSQYSSSYNYDSLDDAFNAVNRKGKMQKKYLSPEYLTVAQEYRDMRTELNKILRKKKAKRTEAEEKCDAYLFHIYLLCLSVSLFFLGNKYTTKGRFIEAVGRF